MKVKVGVIGAGNMGKNHIRLAREMNNDFEFVGVFDPDKERIKMLGLSGCCFETEDALIEAADAVIVAAPSSLHKRLALKVAAEGKHLLVEKPIALSAADGQEIVDAFANTKQVLQVGHVERFNPVVLELEKIVKNEEVVAVHIERCSPMDRRISDTDVVYDLMIHDVDILVNGLMADANVESVTSLGAKVYSENFMEYVETVKGYGKDVYLLEYTTDPELIADIREYCEKMGFSYYVSSSLELVV